MSLLLRKPGGTLCVLAWLFVLVVLTPLRGVSASFLNQHNGYILHNSRETVNDVNWKGAFSAAKTAYVFAHYERHGTPEEEQQLMALQITIRSLKLTKTERDIVVLLSEDARPSTKELLAAEGGLKVKLVPAVTAISECERKYLPIQAWNLVQYERVIYIGQGTLVLLNMDELFLCGEFCMVWSSWLYFTDLLMVFKPDRTRYESLLQHAGNYDVYERYGFSSMHEFSSDECDLHAQEFYLSMFSGVHGEQDDRLKHLGLGRAPLFDVTKGQSHEHVERLPYNYNINAMHYYEYFSFHLIRRLTYANMTIPGHSMGYWGTKPYTYYQSWFFSLHHEYSYWREALLEESHLFLTVSRLLLVGAFLVATERLLPWAHARVFSPAHRRAVSHKTRVFMSSTYGLDVLGMGVGGLTTALSLWIPLNATWVIPASTHPKVAWWLFFTISQSLMYFFLTCISLMYFNPQSSADKNAALLGVTQANAPAISLRRVALSASSVLMSFYFCYSDIYFHFAIKIAVTFFVMLTAFVTHVMVVHAYFRELSVIFCRK
jgi:hypothetical protein